MVSSDEHSRIPRSSASSAPAGAVHEPVLLAEVLQFLEPRSGGVYCDATVGLGGHARAVLEASAPDGRFIGIDRDQDALAQAGAALRPFESRVTLVHSPFSQVRQVLEGLGAAQVDGLLVDLGVSSMQLDRAERGFSFRHEGPLDMRMDRSRGETAAALLRRVSEGELEAILRDFGEERFARGIARAIVRARDSEALDTTAALASIVARAVPRREHHKDPATRTFQALRIAVNQELQEVDAFMKDAVDCLRPGGRLVVIAFHSLEDRIVKRRMRELAGRVPHHGPLEPPPPTLRLLTRHVVTPGEDELARNPRSRSARLRAVEKL